MVKKTELDMTERLNWSQLKNQRWKHNQTYKLLYICTEKGNHKQNKKTMYRLGENICKWYNSQGLDFQNQQIANKAYYKKKKTIKNDLKI